MFLVLVLLFRKERGNVCFAWWAVVVHCEAFVFIMSMAFFRGEGG